VEFVDNRGDGRGRRAAHRKPEKYEGLERRGEREGRKQGRR
jgi:hypothetical protein